MKTRVLFSCAAVLLLALLGYLSFAGERTAPAVPSMPVPVLVPVPASPVDAAPAPIAVERQEVETPKATTAATPAKEPEFDPSPVEVDAWLARFLVVDENDQPVADAVITIWAANKVKPDPAMARMTGQKGNMYSGHAAEVACELRTDASGSAQMRLGFECYCAAASKDGIGRTGDQYLWHATSVAKVAKFVLEMPITLHGVVRRVDGAPAAGAKVSARVNGHMAPQPEPVTADGDGRFAMPVILQSVYNLLAELDGMKTFSERVWIRSRTPPEAVLSFPGAITLDGTVVDLDGKPVPKAEVSAWRADHLGDPQQDARDYERVYTKAGDDGRFSVAVRKHARYQLIASAAGHANSKLQWVETTAVRPHPDARLELPAFASIRGRVERGDGTPFASVRIGARPETGDASDAAAVPQQGELFGRVKSVTSGDDGSFALQVHPETTWTVYAVPDETNYRLRFSQTGVAGGRDDVVIRIQDVALAGCVVHGTVVRADGQPLGDYGVEIVNYEDGKTRSSSEGRAVIDGAKFSLPPLPLGEQFGVRVSGRDGDKPRGMYQGPLAPAQVGPFATDQKELHFEFRLQTWGEVPVRVLDSTGAPARKVRVGAERLVNLGFMGGPLPVDADGAVVLKHCAPGAHWLRVFSDTGKLCEQELLVTPGLNQEVVVQLPAAK